MTKARPVAALLIGICLGAITVAPGFAEAPPASRQFVKQKVRGVKRQVQAIQGQLGSFQQKCRPGANLAFARIPESFASSTYTGVPGYNCTGGRILARRGGQGRYYFRFEGLPVTHLDPDLVAVATVLQADGRPAGITPVTDIDGTGAIEVAVYNSQIAAYEDLPVSLLVLAV